MIFSTCKVDVSFLWIGAYVKLIDKEVSFKYYFFGCSPLTLGKNSHFEEPIFQSGCFNHHQTAHIRSLGQACRVADGGEKNTAEKTTGVVEKVGEFM